MASNKQCISSKHLALRDELYRLWQDHAAWDQEFLVAVIAGLPNADVIKKRLFKNLEDISKSIVPFYGQEAGEALNKLLNEHILIAIQVVQAAIANDKQKLETENEKWHKNARDIAEFLSKANKNWSLDALIKLLYTHIELLAEYTMARINKEWERCISLYDKNRYILIDVANALTEGIVKQFPDRF